MRYPDVKLKKEWIQNPISNEVVEWTKSFAEYLSIPNERKPLTTSQLRKFFGEIKRIDTDFNNKKVDLPMLNPMLAYAVGRDKKNNRNVTKILEFSEEIMTALTSIRNDENMHKDFKSFLKIFESIVAYHKYFGGN